LQSGKIIAKLNDNDEEKKEMMSKKNKLKGEQIFIENDLTLEEKKIQKRINNWVKERKNKGENIKIEIEQVRVKDIWKH